MRLDLLRRSNHTRTVRLKHFDDGIGNTFIAVEAVSNLLFLSRIPADGHRDSTLKRFSNCCCETLLHLQSARKHIH